jgi:Protein of unknown function (DUF2846)
MRACLRNAKVRSLGVLAVVFVLAVAVMGCASSSTPPLAMASLASGAGAPPAGQSRIIVIRPEKGFMGWGDRGVPIALDGQPMGELLTGNYLSADRPPGRHQLTAELWDQPGTSRHDFTAAPGRTYYFAARVKQKVNDIAVASAIGGLAGYAIAAAATNDGSGPVELISLSEADARRAIAAAPQ